MALIATAALAPAAAAGPAPAWSYPPAPRGAVVDDYHGTAVADPYRWLEDLDSPATRAWVAAENQLTFGFLGTLPQRQWLHDRLTHLWNYTRYGLPFRQGGVIFYTKNDGLQNQAVLYCQAPLDPAPRLLLDPNTLSADGTVALADLAVSHDGRWLAYSTQAAGSDWTEIRVRAVATGQDTGDLVRWVKFSGTAWTRDGQGFFYSRFPEPKVTEGTGQTFDDLAGHKLYYHRLGTPQSADRLIFAVPSEPKWLVDGAVTDDGRYAVINLRHGTSRDSLVRYLDLGDPKAPNTAAPAVNLIDTWGAEYELIDSVGPLLYVTTNRDAPRRRVIAIDTRQPDPAHWRTIVPESADVLQSVSLVGGKLVVLSMHDASSRLRAYRLDGQPAGDIALPGIGTVSGISGEPEASELFYNFTSFTYPNANFRHDLATGIDSVFSAPKVAFNPADYETTQIFYPSKDGTRVPMFITAKRGVKRDGTAPTLLYAYGGFDIALTPGFAVPDLVWMEMGGIYAQPCLRGGGEYGRAWHEAGTKERKQNVFDDYIAAAEWLFAHGYTSPAHLVISGDSNGGLLIGATLNQRPDLCRVAWPGVGVMDMLRFQKFTIGWAWVDDYGSSDDPAMFPHLRAYSPVHTVRAGAAYPAVLVTTADHDDRVYPAHSFKYTAQMQAAVADGPGALPVMIRIETKAGHGGGKPTSKRIDEAADKLAFAAHFLGLDPERTTGP